MYMVSEELKSKVKFINKVLLDKYENVLSLDKDSLRRFIEENIGPIININKFTTEELKKYIELGGILGVDGSKNRIGGAPPHFIEIYQGLAKSSIHKDEPVYKTDFYTPLYIGEDEVGNILEDDLEKKEIISSRKLSAIEVEAALEGVRRFSPHAVIMDGSLIRYNIECSDKWSELRRECEDRNIILVGVIKDIKTSIIGDALKEDKRLGVKECFHDRELLYGLLKYGEIVLIDPDANKKEREGFASLFMRSSDAPSVIGMDILDSQRAYLEEMARLVLTLTPKDSRGVPLWLDIIDSEVKIPDKLIRELLESYLDRELLEMLFISERDKRTM